MSLDKLDPSALFALILGPYGVLVILTIAVWKLWNSHAATDKAKDNQLERQTTINESFAAAMPVLTETIKSATEWTMDLAREAYSGPARPAAAPRRRRAPPRED